MNNTIPKPPTEYKNGVCCIEIIPGIGILTSENLSDEQKKLENDYINKLNKWAIELIDGLEKKHQIETKKFLQEIRTTIRSTLSKHDIYLKYLEIPDEEEKEKQPQEG
jgi:hypothetical protein